MKKFGNVLSSIKKGVLIVTSFLKKKLSNPRTNKKFIVYCLLFLCALLFVSFKSVIILNIGVGLAEGINWLVNKHGNKSYK